MTQTEEDFQIAFALQILQERLLRREPKKPILNTSDAQSFVLLKFAPLEREEMGCFFLDAAMCPIAYHTIGIGTTSGCHIYPRELARDCLKQNASSVLIVHNHPSGNNSNFSKDDLNLTMQLRDTLALIDVAILDHMLVCGLQTWSMREQGLI